MDAALVPTHAGDTTMPKNKFMLVDASKTLTQLSPAELRSIDLRDEASKGECDCLRSSWTIAGHAIEIVFFPETNRAGVAAGSDAQWTDASSAADALRRFLNNDMSA